MSNRNGSGQRRRGAAGGTRTGKRDQRPPEHTQQQTAAEPCAPPQPDTAQPEDAAQAGTAAGTRNTDAADSPGGKPTVGPIGLPRRVPGETLTAWDRVLLPAAPSDDPYLRALREDLGEVLGQVAPAVHARTTDTLVMPAVADAGSAPAGGLDAQLRPSGAALPTPPVPSGAPVGPAIPGRYRVEPPGTSAQVTASWTETPVETTRPLHQIPAPSVSAGGPVPVMPWPLDKIFGAPWARVLELWRSEIGHFGPARIAAIHHSPTDQGAAALAAFYGFGRTPLYWDGERCVGGEPREGRMHPAVMMHGFASHVRDHRAPQQTDRTPARETAVQDAPQDTAAGQVAV